MKLHKTITGLMLSALLMLAGVVNAGTPFYVGASQSKLLDVTGVSRVAIADPSVCDVVVLSPDEIIVLGKKPGATNMMIWTGEEEETRLDYDIMVSGDNGSMAGLVQSAIGSPKVKVRVSGGKIILEGTVNTQYDLNRAVKIAESYGPIINLIEMTEPKQIRIESRIIEITSGDDKALGFKVGSTDGNSGANMGTFHYGQDVETDATGGVVKPISSWFGTYKSINAQLTALVEKNRAKVLSQPYIVTLSGQKASVKIGGQIPYKTTSSNGTSTQFKDYGIMLDIEPVVMEDNSVTAKIRTEVSSLGAATDDGYALNSRTADSNVHMKPGMTMAIGGLIDSTDSKTIQKIPLLGDIPILGQFFRNTKDKKEKKEIVILLTPVIVDSSYKPVMSNELQRLHGMKDEEIIEGEFFRNQKETNVTKPKADPKKAGKQNGR